MGRNRSFGRSVRVPAAFLLLVGALLPPGCHGRSESSYVGTWLDAAPQRGKHGEAMQAGYVLEAGGKGKNVTIQDYTKADPAWLTKIEPALSRRMADGRMHKDSAGRYVSEYPCTWLLKDDHILLSSALPLGAGRNAGAKLSADGRSLELGLDQGGKFTSAATGETGKLYKQ